MTGVERFEALAARVLAGPARLGPVRLVSVDGPAGSGKTTFGARLSRTLRDAGASVAEIHTDDLLEGWTGLGTYWPRLWDWVLAPLSRCEPARYRRYDWDANRFEDEWLTVAVPQVLVLEGVGSARLAAAPHLTLSVFVVTGEALRLERGIARDGEALRSNWIQWMSHEQAHFVENQTVRRADLVVDGAPAVAHDPEDQYVLASAYAYDR